MGLFTEGRDSTAEDILSCVTLSLSLLSVLYNIGEIYVGFCYWSDRSRDLEDKYIPYKERPNTNANPTYINSTSTATETPTTVTASEAPTNMAATSIPTTEAVTAHSTTVAATAALTTVASTTSSATVTAIEATATATTGGATPEVVPDYVHGITFDRKQAEAALQARGLTAGSHLLRTKKPGTYVMTICIDATEDAKKPFAHHILQLGACSTPLLLIWVAPCLALACVCVFLWTSERSRVALVMHCGSL